MSLVEVGRWRQILRDTTAAPEVSSWNAAVTHQRILDVDRIRPFVARGAVALLLAVGLMVVEDVRWWAWLAFIPVVAQVVLEIMLETPVRRPDAEAEAAPQVRWIVRVWHRNRERLKVNVTGVLGAVAVLAVVAATIFGAGDRGPGWARVACLALALVYCNSAMLGPLLDVTTYSDNQSGSPVIRALHPWWWVIFAIAAALLVGISSVLGLWPDEAVPYAFVACALPYAMGLRQRDYERDMRAARLAADARARDNNAVVARKLHDLCQPVKRLMARTDGMDRLEPNDVIDLRYFIMTVGQLHQNARNHSGAGAVRMPELRDALRYATASAHADFQVDLSLEQLDDDDVDLATRILTTLVHNASQAYVNDTAFDPWIEVVARPVLEPGAAVPSHFEVRVEDGLALIPDNVWTGSATLVHCQEDIRRRGGQMSQEELADGGKAVKAVWPITRPRLTDRKVG